jgi:hypothetical protein
MDNLERVKQYIICKERGHIARIGKSLTDGLWWESCIYCNTLFREKLVIEEINKPNYEIDRNTC